MDAILLGGGVGSRFAGTNADRVPKQFQLLGNAPVFVHALKAHLGMGCFRQIVITAPKAYVALAQEQIDAYLPPQNATIVRVVQGGDRRQDSSRLALEAVDALSPVPERVLIHDACRPYLSKEFLARVGEKLRDRAYGAWVPVVPVIETLKRVENDRVVETVDRRLIHRVQTPQVFEYSVIRSLVEKVQSRSDLSFTDDASLCEYYGIPVGVFEGDARNIKLTYEFELDLLKAVLCEPESDTTFTA